MEEGRRRDWTHLAKQMSCTSLVWVCFVGEMRRLAWLPGLCKGNWQEWIYWRALPFYNQSSSLSFVFWLPPPKISPFMTRLRWREMMEWWCRRWWWSRERKGRKKESKPKKELCSRIKEKGNYFSNWLSNENGNFSTLQFSLLVGKRREKKRWKEEIINAGSNAMDSLFPPSLFFGLMPTGFSSRGLSSNKRK